MVHNYQERSAVGARSRGRTVRRIAALFWLCSGVGASAAACKGETSEVEWGSSASVGDPCASGGDCGAGLSCLALRDNRGMCSRPCQSNEDCGGRYDVVCGIRPDGAHACVPDCIATDGYACVNETSVACELTGEDQCFWCGCPSGTYCAADVLADPPVPGSCEVMRKLGESCASNEQCDSGHCGEDSYVCRVPYGAPCTDDNCDLCFQFSEGYSWCSKKCDWHTDCGGSACLGFDPDYWCQPPCEGCPTTCCSEYYESDVWRYCDFNPPC